MKQFGQVTGIEGELAQVIIKRHASCGDCHACRLGSENDSMEVKVINEAKAQVGQWVAVDLGDMDVLSAAFASYVIPLFMLLGGLLAGQVILTALGVDAHKDILSGGIALSTMGLAYLHLKHNEKKRAESRRYMPVVSQIVEEDSIGCS